MTYFYIDLCAKNLEIQEYEQRYLNADLIDNEVSDPLALSDFDWRVFVSLYDARYFLDKYNLVLETLDKNYRVKKHHDVPHLLYKRRYLVQTLMGVKNYTVRNYFKDWDKGQLVNLHDQTYFITVEITNVSHNCREGLTTYEFKLCS
jgi:hypothetical protein